MFTDNSHSEQVHDLRGLWDSAAAAIADASLQFVRSVLQAAEEFCVEFSLCHFDFHICCLGRPDSLAKSSKMSTHCPPNQASLVVTCTNVSVGTGNKKKEKTSLL